MGTASARPAPPPLDLVEAFVNSVDLETGIDELETPTDLRKWFVAHGLIRGSDPVRDDDRRQAIRFREALRRAALANNGKALDRHTIHELNQMAQRSALTVAFAADGQPRLDPAAAGVKAALARLVAAVLTANLTGRWSRLKACANDDCQWVFYDASKNRSGRWCDMTDCGNDAKGRAYRARRRSKIASS